MKSKFKILFLNLGYCTGLNGTRKQYIFRAYRYLHVSNRIEDKVLENLKKIIKEENPDLVCITEIKQGKQISSLINKKYPFHDIETKYGKSSILRFLPFFRRNSNAFISKRALSFSKVFLENGIKKLVYEINLPNKVLLILAHLSLRRGAREKQIAQLKNIHSNNDSKILCGDLNTLHGLSEIRKLENSLNIKSAHETPTYPSNNPKRYLDLFLSSEEIKAEARILDNHISDHLPIIANIRI